MLKKYWDYDLTFTACAGFLFLIFINIARLRPVVAPLRPTLVVGVAAIILLLFKGIRRETVLSLGPAGWCWFGITLMAFLSAVFAPKAQDVALNGAMGMVKLFAAYFITFNMVNSWKTLKGLYWVFLLALMAMLYFAVKVMVLTKGRLTLYLGPFYGVNETAMGMAMFLPFCLKGTALPPVTFKWRRRLFVVLAVLCVTVLLRTFSRGGFLALTAVLIVWTARERRKRTAIAVSTGLVALMLSLSTVLYVSSLQGPGEESLASRMQSLMRARDPQARDVSTQGRIDCAKEAIRIWQKYPILGIGCNCYSEHCEWEAFLACRAAGFQYVAAVHNSLLHVLLEHGLAGFILYVALLLTTARNLAIARRCPSRDPFIAAMVEATFIGFIAFLIAGLFLSEQFNWCFVIFTGMAAAARKLSDATARQISLAQYRARSAYSPRRLSLAATNTDQANG